MALVKSAAQILAAIEPEPQRKRGRPRLYRQCSLPGCSDEHHGHGYCGRHWCLWYRWGDPLHVWVKPKRRSGLECACPSHMLKGSM